MGTHVIKMPDIGEGIAQVELVEWFVKVGDMVSEDQVVADVMTDKATVDIPSPVAGRVLALGGQPGEVMAVGSELIRIEVEGAGNLRESAQAGPAAEPVVAAVKAAPRLAWKWPWWPPHRSRLHRYNERRLWPVKPTSARWPPRPCANAPGIAASSCVL